MTEDIDAMSELFQRPADPERDKRTALRLAARATERATKATREQNAAMRFAADAGASLREIAEATGVPHVTVKRMLDRTRSALERPLMTIPLPDEARLSRRRP